MSSACSKRASTHSEFIGHAPRCRGASLAGKTVAGRSDRPGYAVFDILLDVDGTRTWIDAVDLPTLLEEVGLPTAPQVYHGPCDEDELLAAAHGKETWSGGGLHLREGLVVRPARERFSGALGGCAIAKVVSDAYLTRQGGTEYD